MGNKQTSGTMKAAVRRNNQIVFDPSYPMPPDPKPNTDGVLIRVKAAGINPVDYKFPKFILGAIVGMDVAGVIEKIAEGNVSHNFKVGDYVFGKASGSIAEFALAKAGEIAQMPKELSFVEAAAMNVTYLTSLQALKVHGGLKSGGRVLIIGASGGCGTAGIQIAKAMKAGEIVAVCSGKNEEMVRNLGATKVVDYKKTNFVDVYGSVDDEQKFDVVYDCATGSGASEDYVENSRQVLRVGPPAGRYVPINGSGTMWFRSAIKWQAANTHLFLASFNTEDLNTIAKLASEDGLRPVISETLPLTSETLDGGFKKLKGRRTVGKIVFDMTIGIDDVKAHGSTEVKEQHNKDETNKVGAGADDIMLADSSETAAKEVRKVSGEAKEQLKCDEEKENVGAGEDDKVVTDGPEKTLIEAEKVVEVAKQLQVNEDVKENVDACTDNKSMAVKLETAGTKVEEALGEPNEVIA